MSISTLAQISPPQRRFRAVFFDQITARAAGSDERFVLPLALLACASLCHRFGQSDFGRRAPELLCRSFVRAKKIDEGRLHMRHKTHANLHMAQSGRCARVQSRRQWMRRRSKACCGNRLGSGRHWIRPGCCRGAALHRPPAGRFVATGAKLRGDPALTRRERPSG